MGVDLEALDVKNFYKGGMEEGNMNQAISCNGSKISHCQAPG